MTPESCPLGRLRREEQPAPPPLVEDEAPHGVRLARLEPTREPLTPLALGESPAETLSSATQGFGLARELLTRCHVMEGLESRRADVIVVSLIARLEFYAGVLGFGAEMKNRDGARPPYLSDPWR